MEAFLYNLKFATRIHEQSTKVFEKLVGNSVAIHEMIKQSFEIWDDKIPDEDCNLLTLGVMFMCALNLFRLTSYR